LKFLLDQDNYAGTLRFFGGLDHDVVPVAHIGLSQADDETLLRLAQEQRRIFVTRDRDFGNLVSLTLAHLGFIRQEPSHCWFAVVSLEFVCLNHRLWEAAAHEGFQVIP
jgi:predicted nuclease of predicted toxin-antitoxin system